MQFVAEVRRPWPMAHRSGTEQFMLALNIAAFQPFAKFNADMARYIAELKSVPLAQDFSEVLHPGEIEARNDARRCAEGLAPPEDARADLVTFADEFGLRAQLPFSP